MSVQISISIANFMLILVYACFFLNYIFLDNLYVIYVVYDVIRCDILYKKAWGVAIVITDYASTLEIKRGV